MSLQFLSPLGALLALAGVLVVTGIAARERRHGRVRAVLGLRPPGRRAFLPTALAGGTAFALLGAAAAQPVVRQDGELRQRTDAEAYALVDTTRSMLAAAEPGDPPRIERAIAAALDVRRALPDVPFGVASLTNRPLPHLFPTVARDQFELVVTRAVGINRPPPGRKRGPISVATDFQSLEALGQENFFRSASRKRLVVLFSDGESGLYPVRSVVEALQRGGVELIIVRTWDGEERVWAPDGSPEEGYRPSPGSLQPLAHLAALTTGGRVFGEDDVQAVAAAARAYLGEGPAVDVPAPGRTVSLAPYAVLAACVPLAALLLPGLGGRWAVRRSRVQGRLAYNMLAGWRESSPRIAGSRSRGTRAPSQPISSAPRSSTGASSPAGD
jgi:hypothetical protein